tara:strand:- start:138 stop:1439 length:1302 start_codon:yes stop_codon:yes gene_type:complete
MIDLNILRKTPELAAQALEKRGYVLDILQFGEYEQKRKKMQMEVESLQAKRNTLAKDIGRLRSKGENAASLITEAGSIPKKLDELEKKLNVVQSTLKEWLSKIPNLPQDDVPAGTDESSNVQVKISGEPKIFSFEVKDHVELGKFFGLNFGLAARMSGARFSVMRGPIAKLHRAISQYMLDTQTTRHNYLECSVPTIVNSSALYGTGQLPKFKEDLFLVNKYGQEEEENQFLIPTSEVSLANLVADEILAAEDLPLKFTAHSLCFRSEAGSYGKDTKGLIRQHQFEKVELVQITLPDASDRALEEMVGHAEFILQELNLPYRKVLLCAGDMGFAAAKTYDLEVWLPSQKMYREISSCSNCHDFQARRLNTRVSLANEKGKVQKKFVHTLNGSGLAVGRTLVAVLENYQRSDGSVEIPSVLRKYMDGMIELGAN